MLSEFNNSNDASSPKGIKFKHQQQLTDSHCGPAVVEMLLDNLDCEVSQDDIVKAAGVQATLEEHGTRIDQLATAVQKLTPQFILWYKTHCTLDDIKNLIENYQMPVAVEWQGLFEVIDETSEEDGYEDEEGDYGHYSIITHIDSNTRQLIIVDPYKDFVNQDRIFTFKEFLNRWWDTNEVTGSNGKKHLITDKQLLFIITPRTDNYPKQIGMKPGVEFKYQPSDY